MTARVDRGQLSDALWPAAFGIALFGPGMQATEVLSGGEAWSWVEAVLRGGFFGACVALAAMVYLRFSARARERAAVERAVSAGALPDDAGAEWVGRLAAERRRVRSDRFAVPLFSAAVAVLVAAAALQPEGPGGWSWLYVVGLLALGVVVGLREHRRSQTAERLLTELRERLAPA
ncbi:hypothetical protein E4P41_15645 [Geodermatophilus sp. DF01-2]|uniref:hypothetical protein n=1 Tax=Geodermatophilus sp. DF01-2 TaxID=2559610 RepID=UPI001073264F|nr:hypothetical protein [Geodermatophilus sp. DF01_2]TFV56563.1 hypothetical protein E4P41_15645 [Geodermatophilus sp. DF01_2]